MEALVKAANVAGRLPRREATTWVQRLATVAGASAVAEAQEHERSIGNVGTEVLLERVAEWGRRFPRSGDSSFIRCATVAIGNWRILPVATARARLERALGRPVPSLDDGRSLDTASSEHLVES